MKVPAAGPPERLRIAIIGSRGFPSTYGGYETLVREIAPTWAKEGHEVTVYCRFRRSSARQWMEEGVRCRWVPGIDSNSLSTLTFGATTMLDAALRRPKFDVALVVNIANGLFLPLLKMRGIPSVVNTDGIEWERGKWGPAARRTFLAGARLSAKYADRLIADSRAIAEIWQEKFAVDSCFIPYGGRIVESMSADGLASLNLKSQSYVLAVARLVPENNVALLLDAVAAQKVRTPVVIVGSGAYEESLKAKLEDIAPDSDVRWLGHVDDEELLLALWHHCGVYVHGHSVGGTNPALLQALGAGAPVLALDTVFNREVIGSDEQLFPAHPEELGARIQLALDDGEVRARFRDHGRAVIEERYAWPDIVDSYLRVLHQARSVA
jgi:glycosyltransferase involved in cell wall biosynthesis